MVAQSMEPVAPLLTPPVGETRQLLRQERLVGFDLFGGVCPVLTKGYDLPPASQAQENDAMTVARS